LFLDTRSKPNFSNSNMIEDERGLSAKQFEATQTDLKKRVEKAIGEEREKPMRLYFEFDSVDMREAAMNLLNKLRDERKDYDETFRYFQGCRPDPLRPEGIELRFNKNVPGLREKFEALLSEQGIIPREEYKTVADEPVPQETKINR
jgi:hypothetical protein